MIYPDLDYPVPEKYLTQLDLWLAAGRTYPLEFQAAEMQGAIPAVMIRVDDRYSCYKLLQVWIASGRGCILMFKNQDEGLMTKPMVKVLPTF